MKIPRICALTALLGLASAAHSQDPASIGDGIASQPLADAIAEFAEKTGLQVVYESQIAENKYSQGSQPTSSSTEALEQLLAATGVSYVFINENTVALQLADGSTGTSAAKKAATSSDILMAQSQASANSSSQTGNSDSAEGRYYEEVLVTAQIRQQNLQDIPVSGTSFSGTELEGQPPARHRRYCALHTGPDRFIFQLLLSDHRRARGE